MRLCLKAGILLPHSQEGFRTYQIPYQFDASYQLKKSTKHLLLSFVQGSEAAMLTICALVRRAVTPMMEAQSIFGTTGLPVSGESALIHSLEHLFCEHLHAVDSRQNCESDRANWFGKRALVVNDLTCLDTSLIQVLGQLSGRSFLQ